MKIACKCGEYLHNHDAPGDIELCIYTQKEWDVIMSLVSADPKYIPLPENEVWESPKCHRLHYFRRGESKAAKVYCIEE